MRLVEVEWHDSTLHSASTWYAKEDALKAAEEKMLCWSAGFVLCEDEEQITLVLSHSGDDGEVQCPLTIPRSAVVRMTVLRRDLPVVVAA